MSPNQIIARLADGLSDANPMVMDPLHDAWLADYLYHRTVATLLSEAEQRGYQSGLHLYGGTKP